MNSFLSVVVIAVAGVSLSNCKPVNQSDQSGQTSTPAEQSAQTPAERRMDNVAIAVDDATLTAKVKTALIAEPGISALAINVDTKDSVVTLTGQCDTQANVDRAIAVAQSIDGVKSVTNNLTVKS